MPVNPIPDHYSRMSPYLAVKNAGKAIEFYKTVFGATERMRMPGPNGTIGHAELQFGDTVLMLADECPGMGFKGPDIEGARSVMLHLYVEDVDKVFNEAISAGAKVTREIKNQFYGDRSGGFIDPFGHSWHISSHVEDVPMEELKKRSEEAMKEMD